MIRPKCASNTKEGELIPCQLINPLLLNLFGLLTCLKASLVFWQAAVPSLMRRVTLDCRSHYWAFMVWANDGNFCISSEGMSYYG